MTARAPFAIVVVPCHDEAARLDTDALASLVDAHTSLVLVDDGSRDDTRTRLESLAHRTKSRVIGWSDNRGKGEAVRAGLNEAIAQGAELVGYLDADLAAPPREMRRLLDVLAGDSTTRAAIGSRVALLGRNIERRAVRHYLGRVFATGAALTLGLSVYDTQCGAKAFRVDDALKRALAEPFASRWVFDVELLARLIDAHEEGAHGIIEVPLTSWHDVDGSNVRARHIVQAGMDLARIALKRR